MGYYINKPYEKAKTYFQKQIRQNRPDRGWRLCRCFAGCSFGLAVGPAQARGGLGLAPEAVCHRRGGSTQYRGSCYAIIGMI